MRRAREVREPLQPSPARTPDTRSGRAPARLGFSPRAPVRVRPVQTRRLHVGAEHAASSQRQGVPWATGRAHCCGVLRALQIAVAVPGGHGSARAALHDRND
jgi:hypothetical protein